VSIWADWLTLCTSAICRNWSETHARD